MASRFSQCPALPTITQVTGPEKIQILYLYCLLHQISLLYEVVQCMIRPNPSVKG